MSQSIASTPRRGRGWRTVAIAAVIVVPLAFAGLVVGALSNSTNAIGRIPAALVNSDTLIYQTAADGTKKPIFAGRQLVSELVGSSTGLDWTITNAADAKKLLENGSVDAILTVPKNFSTSILSLQSAEPTKANISIRTDDAHSYLTGAVAQSVGDAMVSAFGVAITQQYISGLYAGVGTLGSSLGAAADGASGLATGASTLGGGLGTLANGAASASGGAAALSGGVTSYTGGVDSLGSALQQFSARSAQLGDLSTGVSTFSTGVSGLAKALAAASADLAAGVPGAAERVSALSQQLSQAAAGGAGLATQTTGALSGVQSGIAEIAAGAAKLASGSGPLRSGASQLASAIGSLASGASSASTGATALASGASTLADGLKSGAAKAPVSSAAEAAKTAKIAADPVGLTVVRDHQIGDLGKVLSIYFVPLGLWLGALAVFLVIRPFSRRALGTTAGNARLAFGTLGRAAAITAVQAALLVALLHLSLGVSLALLPATLGFAVLLAFAFTAFHYLLSLAFGRAGLVVSLLLLALQLTSTAGLYPVQLLAAPFRIMSPFLPLTYGVQGMQAIIAGGSVGSAISASIVLLIFGVLSLLLGMPLIARIRRAQALGLAAPAAMLTGRSPQPA